MVGCKHSVYNNGKMPVLVSVQFSSVQSLSRVWPFATSWIAARQGSLFITISRSWLRLMSIESVMPSSHLILCCPLLLLPPIPPSIRVFSSESTLRMRWPKHWSFSFNIIPSKEIHLKSINWSTNYSLEGCFSLPLHFWSTCLNYLDSLPILFHFHLSEQYWIFTAHLGR